MVYRKLHKTISWNAYVKESLQALVQIISKLLLIHIRHMLYGIRRHMQGTVNQIYKNGIEKLAQLNLLWHSVNPSFLRCYHVPNNPPSFWIFGCIRDSKWCQILWCNFFVPDCRTCVERSKLSSNILHMVHCFRLPRNLRRMVIRW